MKNHYWCISVRGLFEEDGAIELDMSERERKNQGDNQIYDLSIVR